VSAWWIGSISGHVAEEREPENTALRRDGLKTAEPQADSESRPPRKPVRDMKRGEPITPEEAKELLAKARANPDSRTRVGDCIQIIERMCRSGFVEEAWSMIYEDPSEVRSSELMKFFACTNLDVSQFIAKVEDLPYQGEARDALLGYLSGLDAQGASKLLNDELFRQFAGKVDKSSPGAIGRAIASNLMGKLAFPGGDSEKLQARDLAVTYFAEGWINEDEFVGVLRADSRSSGFEKWHLLGDVAKNSQGSEALGKLRRDVISEMVTVNAVETFEELIKVSGEQSSKDFMDGVGRWAAIDSKAASQWFQSNKARLNQTQYDGGAFAFFEQALHYGETEGAENWAKEIAEPGLRQRALDRLPKKEDVGAR
jgi:hypothetical protein